MKSSVTSLSCLSDVRNPRTCCQQTTVHPVQNTGARNPTQPDNLRNQPTETEQRAGKGFWELLTTVCDKNLRRNISKSVRDVFVMLRWSGGTRASCRISRIAWSSPTAPIEACRTTSSSSKDPMPVCLESFPSAALHEPLHPSDCTYSKIVA